MPVAFVAASQGGANSATSASIARPSSVVDGDVLVAVVQGGTSSRVYSAPAGWTRLRLVENAGGGGSVSDPSNPDYEGSIWYRVAASEPSSYTFTADANAWFDVVVAAYRGANTSTPIDASAGLHSNDKTAPSVTASRADGRLITTYGYRGGAGWTAPSGMAERGDSNVGANISRVALYDKALTASGVTGLQTASGGGTPAIKFTVALLSANVAPNAPRLIAPIAGRLINRDAVNRFSWEPSDPDADDFQSKAEVRYRLTSSSTWTTVAVNSPNAYYDFAAGTFAEDKYEWQARTYDADGLVGPWSGSGFFTAGARPTDTPTFVTPIDGETIGSSTFPVTLSLSGADEYRLRVYNPDGVALTDVLSSLDGQFTISGMANSQTIELRGWIIEGGFSSRYYATVTVRIAYTPPATPRVSVKPVKTVDVPGAFTDTVQLFISNPAPTSGQPRVRYCEVWRRYVTASGSVLPGSEGRLRNPAGVGPYQVASGSFYDRTVPSGVEVEYAANAVADNGTTAMSVWTAGETLIEPPAAEPLPTPDAYAEHYTDSYGALYDYYVDAYTDTYGTHGLDPVTSTVERTV